MNPETFDRIHPDSVETLRQLIKLHGIGAVLAAIAAICDESWYYQTANALRRICGRDK